MNGIVGFSVGGLPRADEGVGDSISLLFKHDSLVEGRRLLVASDWFRIEAAVDSIRGDPAGELASARDGALFRAFDFSSGAHGSKLRTPLLKLRP